MTNDNLIKSIRGVVKEEINTALKPIKITLEKHTKKLDGITDQLSDVSEDVSEIKENVGSHEKRISKIEDHIGISTPTD
ncbi:hypothetical protein A3B51_03630 [Candidatus Curtissbacteria bacterium RIFCSPLOWO2_01_FULL_41_18]|uniref:t-SNARE coiled-coil homology domain-containing protein n=1 Tax=Candidatus Curtissbacteria bacterium RIFCSPLOWO2_01_FULL_41_18 TaxID=1797727 RepID=A0A1F5HL44_9BACT|nr:MAG: hypothetical protein A3B51_03630 [Candidatus Curtissbacteria bacterium RIFCSPLOWO2_01_FULL_41_18]OGH17815.1 MAG: hypothetical protein A2868_03100 [Candidatus Levybacteria bacterium RIFCSPHIGHO2_01_FULL_40_15b]